MSELRDIFKNSSNSAKLSDTDSSGESASGNTDDWQDDDHEQPYLMPGTESYEAMQAVLQQQKQTKLGDADHEEWEAENVKLRERQLKKSQLVNDAYHIGNRKYRREASKRRQNKEIEAIIEKGLGKDIDLNGGFSGAFDFPMSETCNDELYDDGISADEYKKAVIRDYKPEFEKVASEDKDHDGEADEWTPGMRKLSKYL